MKTSHGFTLIEMMIVVAIFAIIMAVGFPMYLEQAYKGRRADAKVALTESAQSLERCRTNTNTYTGCGITATSPEGYYAITLASAADSYTLTATAKSDKAQANDAKCITFTLSHTGAKTATNTNCW